MGVSYDRKYGIQHLDPCSWAGRGDIIKAYGKSYRVISTDGYGDCVCVPFSDDDYDCQDIKTFDELDITEVISPNDPRFTACGAGI